MDANAALVMLVALVVFGVGGIVLLLPLAYRLGKLLEVVVQEKRQTLESRSDLGMLEKRIHLMEERLAFSEQLQAGIRRSSLPGDESDSHPSS